MRSTLVLFSFLLGLAPFAGAQAPLLLSDRSPADLRRLDRIPMTTGIDSLSPDRLAENLVELLAGSEIPDVGNIPPLDGTQRATDILFSDVEGLESAH